MNQQLLCKVEYTDDTEKLCPHILKEYGEKFSIALGELGNIKIYIGSSKANGDTYLTYFLLI